MKSNDPSSATASENASNETAATPSRSLERMVRPIAGESETSDPMLLKCLQVIGEALKRQNDSMRCLVLALEDGFSRPVAVLADQKVSGSEHESPDQISQSLP